MLNRKVERLPEKVTVTSPCRLHFNSLKMNYSMGRGCGGVGLALKNPDLKLEIWPSKDLKVICENPIVRMKVENFARIFLSSTHKPGGAKILVSRFFANHCGLGSGTQIGLSVGTGLNILCGKKSSCEDVARTSGRAGVSGVGYYAFRSGGLVVDGGYRIGANEQKKNFADHATTPPSLLFRGDFPLSWKILLIIPPPNGLSGDEESKFFSNNTPVPQKETDEICAKTLMGILPAVQEKNFPEFLENLRVAASLGTKKCELELNKATVRLAKERLKGILGGYDSAAIGLERGKIPFLSLSSIGSSLYAFLDEGSHDCNEIFIETRNRLPPSWPVFLVSANNQGAEIMAEYDGNRRRYFAFDDSGYAKEV